MSATFLFWTVSSGRMAWILCAPATTWIYNEGDGDGDDVDGEDDDDDVDGDDVDGDDVDGEDDGDDDGCDGGDDGDYTLANSHSHLVTMWVVDILIQWWQWWKMDINY